MADQDIRYPTSPRKLQEVALPVADGHVDVTASSGISMKQYEEQISGLRKENFHLKLRIYFLEEKLGSGSPPAVQGLLEHNVRLQVELEELKRQLTDKQELLAAAAEAIDVLEQQGSLSIDSEEGSTKNTSLQKTTTCTIENETENETKLFSNETPSHGAHVTGDLNDCSVKINELEEVLRLRCENQKALHMIQGCMKRIQQQEKQIRRLTKDKSTTCPQVSDSQLEKYEELIRNKDEHIRDLELKIKLFEETNVHSDDSGNLQDLLTRRLQGLAYFLDKLLSHKCVLGEEKKKMAESLLEQSLALPVGLKLDESVVPCDFSMDESNLDISHSLRMEDLTMMFGHHAICDESIKQPMKRSSRDSMVRTDLPSESECWSEPDRNVSLARIGLCDIVPDVRESSFDGNRHKLRRSRGPCGLREETKSSSEIVLQEQISQLTKHIEHLQNVERNLSLQLDNAESQIQTLLQEKDKCTAELDIERSKLVNEIELREKLGQKLQTVERHCIEIEQKLESTLCDTDKVKQEKQELEATFSETERALRRAADEAAVQASQAALERARAQHERLRVERELEETRAQLAVVQEEAAQAALKASSNMLQICIKPSIHVKSEDERPTSPDQGIDSDRLSSLEQGEPSSMSPRSLYEENVILKQKLTRTKATLADTLAQLNAANMRKRSVQRAICREIHKTHGVLRKARDQFENQN